MIQRALKWLPAWVHDRIAHRPGLLKILDNISWLFFDKILRMGVGLLVGVWVARYLGPEQFGLLSFALAFVGLFGAVATLGLHGIVVRDIVRDQTSANETLGTAFALQLLGGLTAYLLLLAAINYFRPDDALARTIVAILGFTLVLKASETIKYWFESQVQSKFVVWVENGVFLVIAGAKVAMILLNVPLMAFVWAAFAEALLVAVFLFAVYGLKIGSLSSWNFDFARGKTLLRNSWPLILSGIAVSIYMKIDQIMLGQIIGDEAVGIYSVAVRISEVWYFAIPIVLASVFPTLANLHARKSPILSIRWVQTYSLMFWLSVVVAILLTFSSNFVILTLFGEAYSGADVVLAIHVWAGVNVAVGSVWSKWLLLENKLQIGLYGHLIGAVINIVLNIWLIPNYGAAGAALATLISYWLSAIFVYSLHKPESTFSYIADAISLRGVVWN